MIEAFYFSSNRIRFGYTGDLYLNGEYKEGRPKYYGDYYTKYNLDKEIIFKEFVLNLNRRSKKKLKNLFNTILIKGIPLDLLERHNNCIREVNLLYFKSKIRTDLYNVTETNVYIEECELKILQAYSLINNDKNR